MAGNGDEFPSKKKAPKLCQAASGAGGAFDFCKNLAFRAKRPRAACLSRPPYYASVIRARQWLTRLGLRGRRPPFQRLSDSGRLDCVPTIKKTLVVRKLKKKLEAIFLLRLQVLKNGADKSVRIQLLSHFPNATS